MKMLLELLSQKKVTEEVIRIETEEADNDSLSRQPLSHMRKHNLRSRVLNIQSLDLIQHESISHAACSFCKNCIFTFLSLQVHVALLIAMIYIEHCALKK